VIEMTSLSQDFDRLIEQIAKKNMNVETLKTRNSDSLDFHNVAVWSIKKALEEAFIAGMNVGNSIAR
jgi:hypothetical protein